MLYTPALNSMATAPWVTVLAAVREAALTGTSGIFLYRLLSIFSLSSLQGICSWGCHHGLASRLGCSFLASQVSMHGLPRKSYTLIWVHKLYDYVFPALQAKLHLHTFPRLELQAIAHLHAFARGELYELIRAKRVLIDTSQKKSLRVCTCARVHACSTNLGFIVWYYVPHTYVPGIIYR